MCQNKDARTNSIGVCVFVCLYSIAVVINQMFSDIAHK